MRIVALFIALIAVFALFSAIVGTDPPIWILGHRISGRIESCAITVACAAALYGIYRRAQAVWWFGSIVLAASWIEWVSSLSSPGEWERSASLALLIVTNISVTALLGYFTFRWYQERRYFFRDDTPQV